jgi:hypothetical protein
VAALAMAWGLLGKEEEDNLSFVGFIFHPLIFGYFLFSFDALPPWKR